MGVLRELLLGLERLANLLFPVVLISLEIHHEVRGEQLLILRVVELGKGFAAELRSRRWIFFPELLGADFLRVVVGHALGVELSEDVADGLELGGGLEETIHDLALAGKEDDAISEKFASSQNFWSAGSALRPRWARR